MAATVNTAGPAQVQTGTGTSDALETLGYTRNGADIDKIGFWTDVPGDQNGGDEGPPIEVQYMGEIARVRLELTKWDVLVEDKIVSRLKGGTAGTVGTAGTLMFSGLKTFRVVINTTTRPFDFPRAIHREPRAINRGTKFSTLVMEFECHKDDSGVLWDHVTS